MGQDKLNLLFAYIRILASRNQVHNRTNTTVNCVQSTVSGETSRKKHLNQVIGEIGEMFLLVLDTYHTQIVDDFARMVKETG
jgi:hypothetical protein